VGSRLQETNDVLRGDQHVAFLCLSVNREAAMAHDVDRYQLASTGRSTWRAEWRDGTESLGVIPVTGDEDRVWYRKRYWEEMEARLADECRFVIALSKQETSKRGERRFKHRGIYKVVATGERASEWGIKTRIVRRIRSRNDPA
jgi:hypothetical protein